MCAFGPMCQPEQETDAIVKSGHWKELTKEFFSKVSTGIVQYLVLVRVCAWWDGWSHYHTEGEKQWLELEIACALCQKNNYFVNMEGEFKCTQDTMSLPLECCCTSIASAFPVSLIATTLFLDEAACNLPSPAKKLSYIPDMSINP